MQEFWYTLTLVMVFRNISQSNGGTSLEGRTWTMKAFLSRTTLSTKPRIGEKLGGQFV